MKRWSQVVVTIHRFHLTVICSSRQPNEPPERWVHPNDHQIQVGPGSGRLRALGSTTAVARCGRGWFVGLSARTSGSRWTGKGGTPLIRNDNENGGRGGSRWNPQKIQEGDLKLEIRSDDSYGSYDGWCAFFILVKEIVFWNERWNTSQELVKKSRCGRCGNKAWHAGCPHPNISTRVFETGCLKLLRSKDGWDTSWDQNLHTYYHVISYHLRSFYMVS